MKPPTKNAEKINYNNNINLVYTRRSLAYFIYYKELCGEAENRVPFIGTN